MRKQLLSALAITLTWVGFDGSGHVGSIARAHVVGGNECWVTGGGWIDLDGTKATFGFNGVNPHLAPEPITGHVTAVDHESPQTALFCKIDTLTCDCDLGLEGSAQLQGTLYLLGAGAPAELGPCSVTVTDNGEPGANDTISFDVFPGSDLQGVFLPLGPPPPANGGGNVQIHGCRGPGLGM